MTVSTLAYESTSPLSDDQRFLCFLVRPIEERVKNKRTGRIVQSRLPMVFFGSSEATATHKALQWWEAETRKEREKVERGQQLAARRK